MSGLDLMGYLAGFCTTVAFVPQVLKVWRSQSARDISVGMYAVFLVGLFLWFLYGCALRSWPVIIANGLTMLLAGAVLVMKLRYDSRPPTSDPP
jgi:MtN3 and saliva related transmembrane protein